MEGEDEPKPKTKWSTKRYKTTKQKQKETDQFETPGANKENESSNKQYERLPENLAGMLDKMVGQLDMVTRTVCLLEKRMSDHEDTVDQVVSAFEHHKRTQTMTPEAAQNIMSMANPTVTSIAAIRKSVNEIQRETLKTVSEHSDDFARDE